MVRHPLFDIFITTVLFHVLLNIVCTPFSCKKSAAFFIDKFSLASIKEITIHLFEYFGIFYFPEQLWSIFSNIYRIIAQLTDTDHLFTVSALMSGFNSWWLHKYSASNERVVSLIEFQYLTQMMKTVNKCIVTDSCAFPPVGWLPYCINFINQNFQLFWKTNYTNFFLIYETLVWLQTNLKIMFLLTNWGEITVHKFFQWKIYDFINLNWSTTNMYEKFRGEFNETKLSDMNG